jgi:hypothetical protein
MPRGKRGEGWQKDIGKMESEKAKRNDSDTGN